MDLGDERKNEALSPGPVYQPNSGFIRPKWIHSQDHCMCGFGASERSRVGDMLMSKHDFLLMGITAVRRKKTTENVHSKKRAHGKDSNLWSRKWA